MVRTLNADLVTAQTDASHTPYLRVVFDSFDRATSRVYATSDATNRILQVQQAEGRFGSYTLVEGRPFVISSIIRLQNSDNALSGLDFKGYRVYIEWGYNTVSGNRTSRAGPEFVVSQEILSTEGVDYLELYTISLWELANQLFVNIGNTTSLTFVAGGANSTKISYILMELLGGGVLDSAFLNDGGVFTDFTSEAEDTATSFGLLPATPVVNDEFYFGKLLKFDRLSIDVTQILSSGSVTLRWEYSQGAGVWATLSPLTQTEGGDALTHLDFTSLGIQIEAFDMPSDWAVETVNGVGSTYWVRARVIAHSSPVTQIQATRAFGGQDFAFALDTNIVNQGDDYLPTYSTHTGSQLGPVISDIMDYTLMGLRAEEDGFHAAFINNLQATPDETYDLGSGPHFFFIHTEGQQVTVPNRVIVVSADLDSGAAPFASNPEGVDNNDSGSQGEIGIIPRIYVREEVSSTGEADTIASRILVQVQRDKVQGRVEVPLHCGQEVWDEVRVVDSRTGNTVDGRVSQVIRLYSDGKYTMQVVMGGAIWAVGPPDFVIPAPVVTTEELLKPEPAPPVVPLAVPQPLAPFVPAQPFGPSPLVPRPIPLPPPVSEPAPRVPGQAPPPPSTEPSPIEGPVPLVPRPVQVPVPPRGAV